MSDSITSFGPLDESDLRSGYGELLLCGSQVTPSYLNRIMRTNGKFIWLKKTILPSGIIAQEILFNIIPQEVGLYGAL
ncbi:hypothetical protein KIF59_14265 [Enterobacter cloacae subsp. cloacae]|nr:hypothetical protein [Enterobacter cloacae subsp. cloacae]